MNIRPSDNGETDNIIPIRPKKFNSDGEQFSENQDYVDKHNQDNGSNFFKGVVFGLPVSSFLWLFIYIIVKKLWSH